MVRMIVWVCRNVVAGLKEWASCISDSAQVEDQQPVEWVEAVNVRVSQTLAARPLVHAQFLCCLVPSLEVDASKTVRLWSHCCSGPWTLECVVGRCRWLDAAVALSRWHLVPKRKALLDLIRFCTPTQIFPRQKSSGTSSDHPFAALRSSRSSHSFRHFRTTKWQ
jgi:hypothetical protein